MADENRSFGSWLGGTMMKRIIDDVFAATYGSEELAQGNDAALLPAPAPRRAPGVFPPTRSWSHRISFPAATSAAWPCAAR